MRYIANVSGGKDSLAQILFIMENDIPCDEVVFYDSSMEFKAVYRIFEKLTPLLQDHGIKLTTIHPDVPFLYEMLEKPITSKQKGMHYGYGWCGGVCRWGTTRKARAIDGYAKDAIQYIGIAADEQHRRGELTAHKRSILIEHGMTEADCLEYCRSRGWTWHEDSTVTECGYIDLYDILDRVSCWCCSNKNMRELRNIRRFLPQYWEELKNIQRRLDRPMKDWYCKKYGDYGNVFDMERVFDELDLRKDIKKW